MFRTWWQKFFSFPRSRFARRRGYRPPTSLVRRTTRLSMTALEDRITPAFNMTLSNFANVGVTLTTAGTTTTFTATATGANVAWGSINAALATGNSVVVTTGTAGTEAGNITDQTGGILLNLPGNQSLTFQSGTGAGLVGDIFIFGAFMQGTNESLVINAHHNASEASLGAGTPTAPTPLASATITAATGSISQTIPGPDGPIYATNLALSASTGIGSAGTPLPTQVSNLVAQTGTGGIFVGNTGALNIGFAGAPFQGVTDTGASGDISISSVGGINVNSAVDASAGSGSVSITASQNITVNAGVTVKTSAGNLTLSANEQATATAGNFYGVDIEGATIQATGTGIVNISGKGGNDASGQQVGVLVENGGVISGGTTGTTIVSGTGGGGTGSGNFGIVINGANAEITSAGSAVSVTGQGTGSGATGNASGIDVQGGGVITAGGTGAVTVNGTGGGGTTSLSHGVLVRDAGSMITSGGGNVSVTGTGGGTGASTDNLGIEVFGGAVITAGGTGTVTVMGTGGGGSGSDNTGVAVSNPNAEITSSGGAVSVIGIGGAAATGGSDRGVWVVGGGTITSGGTATVTVMGTGGAGSGANQFGVFVQNSGSTITSAGGNVSVTGQGGGSGTGGSNYGVTVQGTASITAGSSGTVTVMGTGGANDTAGSDIGVLLTGSGATITSNGGNVSVTGQGGGTGASGSNYGVGVGSGDTITAGGTGTVTVMGTGGATSGGSDAGVVIAGVGTAATITSGGGNVSVTGIGGGTGAGNTNVGVAVQGMASITAGGTGTVSVTGTGGATTGSENFGVWVTVAGAQITSNDGTVTVIGTVGGGTSGFGVDVDTGTTISSGGTANLTVQTDSLEVNGTAVIQGGAAGNEIVTLVTLTTGTTIDLGGADAPGTLGLSNVELGQITAGILRIGNANGGNGSISITAAITAPAGWNTLELLTGIVGDTITQSSGASLAVTNLVAAGAAGVTLTDPGNTVSLLAADASVGSAISFVNSTGFTVGSVDTGLPFGLGVGVNSSHGAIALTALGGGSVLTVNSAVTTLAFGGASTGANITLSADDMAINAGVDGGTGGIVTLEQGGTNSRSIDLGAGTTAGDLGLSNTELAEITAGTLRIGRADNPGNITVTAAVSGFTTLTLTSGGSITDAASSDTITATNLAVRAGTGISLDTKVTDLAVRNTTSGNVRVANTGATTLTAVDNLNGSAGNQQGNFGSGTTTFSAASPFTYAIDFTSGGTITTVTTDDGPIDTDNITVDPNVTVESTGGDIEFEAGDDIVIDATGTVKSDTGNIDFRSGFNDTDGEGIMTLDGTLSAGGSVTLNVLVTNATAPAGTNGVTEGAAGTITANGLLLYDFPNPASALPFVLNASTTNAVGTIAANTVASISYADSGALTIGTVNSPLESLTTSGMVTGNNAITLTAAGNVTFTNQANAGTAAVSVTSTNGTITQPANQSAFPAVVGGAIKLSAGGSGGINVAVDTTTPSTAGVTATTTNAPILLFSASQLAVNSINAGTGNVTLHVTNANTATSSITSLSPNDNVADITGGTVTLTADGAASGNTGQIGFFSGSAQFLEVAATTLNASTNNSRLWISLIGGAAIGSVKAGTNTAFLRTFNGTLTSTHTGNTPDITAGTVNLSQSPASATGAFGTAANPLLVQTSNLTANLTAGLGSINVTNVAAGGNLAVTAAKTLGGPINLAVNGGNLTTTATTGTDISAPGGTVTLSASGAVVSGTPAGVTDVSAGNLAIIAGAGIGSAANPLKTAITNLAFQNTGGSVTLVNTGGLTINAVGSLLTSSNTGTTTSLTAMSPMTFAVNTTSAGTLTAITVDDNGPSVDNITVNPGVTVESTGGDVVFDAGDDDVIDGTVESTFRDVDLEAGFGDTDGEGVISIGAGATVSAVATVTLNVNATDAALPANTPIVNEAATASITAAGLLLLNAPTGAPGPFSLDASTTNSVGTIAATTNAVINFRDSTALTVGTVTSTPEGVTSLGILTHNHDATLCTIAGDISLTQALNVGTGTARLQSAGAVSQNAAGTITATNLGVNATGNIGLDQATNAVPGTVALNSTGGSVAFMDADGFTIGTVAASGCFTGASGISGTGDITLCTGANIILAAPLDTTGTVRLQAGGTITQTAAGTITAANLGVRADGNIGLCVSGAANTITGTFAADTSGGPAGSSVMFLDADGFTVGTITASGCFTADAVGVTTNNGDADLVSTAGPISIAEPVNAGTGTVRLNSGGNVSQTAAGTITAANLAVLANGTIALCVSGSPNAVTGNFAASGSAVQFADTPGFTVGTVAGDACATGATGVTSTGGDIDLVSTAGPIVLTQAVNAGTGTVRINSGAAVTQTIGGAGAITAANLAVLANGTVDLCEVANTVTGNFAAQDTGAGAGVMFKDTAGFTVGTVAGDACAAGATGVVTNNGDADLVSTAGPISIAEPVNAGTGTVRLNSGGNVSQTAAGTITAANLAVLANGTIALCVSGSPNAVTGNFAASGSAVQFADTPGFTVGTVAGDACATGATGVTSTGGDIDLVSTAGPIVLTQAVNAGTGTVRINSGAAVTQTIGGAGAITAANLAVLANGTVDLCEVANTVTGNFAAQDTGAGAGVMFKDTAGFTVGTVAGDACAAGATGVVTNNGDADLVSTAGPISIAEPVNAGTGTVRLNSGGNVSQTAAGTITAANLAVLANGTIALCVSGSPNAVTGNFAASGSAVQFADTPGFTVGTVAGDACATGATGVTSTGGDIDLVSTAGPIVLTQAVNAGTGTVRINSGAAVTQTIGGAGAITAANLAVLANGTVDLCEVANTVTGNFAAQDTGAGAGVMFKDTAGFTVGTVAGDACAAGATGVVTNNGDIDLVSIAGPVILTEPVNAGTGTVRINSGGADATGSVYQSAGGKGGAGVVTAANLAVVANGAVDLSQLANAVTGNVAVTDAAAGAPVRFLDTPGFTVGTVAGDACATGATGVTTSNGLATLVSNTGAIQVQQAINLGTGTARLQAATGITSTAATGTITAAALAVRNMSSGDIQLDQANAIGVLAAVNGAAGAGINVRSTGALLLDTVSADGTLFAALNNVTTTGSGGTVRLQAAGLSQTANGIVTTDLLGVENTAGNVILDQSNAVNTFAAANTAAGGRITLDDGNALVLGTVGAQGTFAAVNGITTNAGTTYLQAAGNVTQTAAGLVNSQALAVGSSAGGTIRLDQGNTVATFAADEATAGGIVNLRTTSGLTLDTVTSGSALLAPIAGVTTNAGTVLLHAANGFTQTAAGLIDSATLAVRNDTLGDISLLQTNYVTNVGNQVGTFAGVNGAAGGRLDFATLGALTLGTVAGDGTFAQVRGLTTNNGESNLRTGTNFTAVDTNYASPLISLGSGDFLLNPGLTGDSIVTFNAEAQTTGTFRLGQRNSTAPEPQAPGVSNATNPPGTPGTDNVHADTFDVRPSVNVMILVNGNQPPPGPGKDVLNLILTSVPITTQITFTPGGPGAGRFDFTGGAGTPKPLAFTGIETVGGRGIVAASTQTGPTTYSITAAATIFGRVLTGGLNGGQVPSNPFIVSPNPVNPVAPFGAPRLAVGDFNGDGVPDLIVGNGPDNSPLVTVVNGNNLFGPAHALGTSDLLSQFFAYNQNFQGGMFVAAGNLDGDGRTEIVTGADAGGGPHVRIFAFNPAPGLTIFNNVVDDAVAHPGVSAFPAGGFYAYAANFTGGVRVAVADVNGDGRDDIITGAGAGGGPHVRVFSGTTGQVLDSFYAYAPNFTGGVYVAGGDYNGDGKADIITGSGAGGPHIRVFSGANLSVLASFYAFGADGGASLFGADLGNTSGVGSVAYGNNMDAQGKIQPIIIVGSARGPKARIAVFQGDAQNPPVSPPTIKFTAATNPFPSLYTIDTTAFDPLDLDDLISIPPLRDGANVAGEAF